MNVAAASGSADSLSPCSERLRIPCLWQNLHCHPELPVKLERSPYIHLLSLFTKKWSTNHCTFHPFLLKPQVNRFVMLLRATHSRREPHPSRLSLELQYFLSVLLYIGYSSFTYSILPSNHAMRG